MDFTKLLMLSNPVTAPYVALNQLAVQNKKSPIAPWLGNVTGGNISNFLSPRTAYAYDPNSTSGGGTQTSGDILGAQTPKPVDMSWTQVPYSTPSGGGGGGGGGGGSVPTGDQTGVDLAKQAYDNRVREIQNMFGAVKEQAANIRGQGDRTFNDLLKAVGAFRDRSKELQTNASQEILNTSSENLGGNARSAQELMGTSRALGRAMNLGDSSKFNQQNKILSNLGSTQGNVLAKKGENDMANTANFNSRMDQAQAQENSANTYKQGINDQATALENTGLSQFGDRTAEASNSFGTALNNIMNYQRSLAAISPLNAGALTQLSPDFGGIINNINSSSLPNQTPSTGNPNQGNPVSPNQYLALMDQLRKKQQGTYQG